MAVRFSVAEVKDATGARLTRAGSRAAFDAVCTDTRTLTPGCLFVALAGERFDAHDFLAQAADRGAAGVVVAAGRGGALEGRAGVAVFEADDPLRALGRLGRAHRDRFSVPLGAVTGSNGKTTTKELVASILQTRGPALKTQGNLNNEVGVPLTLFGLEPRHVAAVVELGMNHAGEIARLTDIARPDAGLITVVQPAHLEGLGSLEGVALAKGELFEGLGASAVAVVNLDDERVAAQARRAAGPVLGFGRSPGAEVRLLAVRAQGRDGLSLSIGARGATYEVALRLVGDHNALNATGAFAMGLALGYGPDECVRGLESAQAHARRLQLLDARGGVTVVDDCYNANPASMEAALETLTALSSAGRPVAVLGDMLELGADEARAHQQLGVAASDRAQVVAFFGPRMKAAHAQAAKRLGEAARHFDDVGALTAWLSGALAPGDVVLVKGSRGMRLERVVDALTGRAGPGGH
ncbi:MAG: UDP-N-acetylmuramoyl-tripeptide--D-alanyl-D-alanine ligase [Myxococcaceae bacterium]|nr:UDP-N-acetylmuramoyl-tripeptide--D-alanyl-D-alanine ligase [Myxococcaceae bacterium]MCA3014276.1 UDP-N-acetylmuramoyl-tripeptide--D-alanyl-D-alanine ligase [Myxococcaceae bacterium]